MPVPISPDLRLRVTDAHHRGEGSYEDLGKRFAIGVASVSRWLRLLREVGSVAPKGHGGGEVSRIPDDRLDEFKELIHKNADATLKDLVEIVADKMHIEVSTSTLGRTFKRAKITRKKSPSTQPSKIRPKLSSRRGAS